MQAKWQGIEMREIYLDWAEVLSSCSLGAIYDAIRISRIEQHPPNLGEFLAYCRQYQPPIDESKLIGYDRHSTITISREDGLKMLDEIKKKITIKMTEQTKEVL